MSVVEVDQGDNRFKDESESIIRLKIRLIVESRWGSVVGILEEYLQIPGVGSVGVLNARFPRCATPRSLGR